MGNLRISPFPVHQSPSQPLLQMSYIFSIFVSETQLKSKPYKVSPSAQQVTIGETLIPVFVVSLAR